MDKKDLYIEKLNAQLKEWSASIDVLKAKADKANADLKIGYYKQLDDLKTKRDTARNKIDDLKAAGDDAWERMTMAVEKSWGDIKAAFDKAQEGRSVPGIVLERVPGGQVRADRPRVRRPRDVDPDHERLPLLEAQPAADAVLEAEARPVELGVRGEVGPQATEVGEQGAAQGVRLAEHR